MPASVTLNVSINKADAEAGLKKISEAIKPLTTPVKLNIDTKAAVSSLKDLNTIASNLEKTLQKAGASGLLADKIKNGYASKNNVIDQAIRASEAASRAYSAALREQMQAEQEAANSRRGLVSEMNAWDQAIHVNEASGKAFSNALRQQMQAEQEAAREAKSAGSSLKDAGSAASKSGSDAQAGAKGWTVLGGVLSNVLGNLASRALQMGLRAITTGLREAMSEMKDVDTQLTNISKVSGKTGDELAAIGDRAYDTASQYGEAASTYLESVYNMQKAGMGDQSEAMGELAIKTMLVGDTTEDVASKFLIASNAAWKLDGNMSRLSQIVDEADYINNNYATSLDKLAAGMPIVASIAAQTGMTAEETMAAIGTITAATQESGTKAATALRALILNISGEVGKYLTEEGEEFEVTEESVKSMQGLLEKYAKTEMDAAKAAGELIDPMTAIKAIFKGMKEDDLTDVELFNLLSGMGGKLRTNQLTALVQNFETLYKDMMDGMKDAAGTADKEIELMMNSWERKTQKLKNTWTEFIADIVETDFIKGQIDWLTEMIDGLDGMVGQAKNPFYDSDTINGEIESTTAKIESLKEAMSDLKNSGQYDPATLRNLEYELEIQQKILELKEKQYKMEHEEEAKKLQDKLTEKYVAPFGVELPYGSRDEEILANLNGALDSIQFIDAAQYQKAFADATSATKGFYDQIKMIQEVLGDGALTEAQRNFISLWEEGNAVANANGLAFDGLVDGIDGAEDAYIRLVDAEGNVIAYAKNTVDVVQEQIDAIDEQNNADEVRTDVVDDLIQKQQELTEAQQAFDEASDPGERAKAYAELDAAQMAYFDAMREASDAELAAATEATAGAGALEAAEAGATGEAEATASAADGIDFSSATAGANALAGALAGAAAAAQSISVGPIGFGGGGHATGTKNAPGGPTLVNELGPELISENGRAYIANGGKPGVVNLSKGAIVLTAKETRDALRGGNGAVRNMHAAAYGSGKVNENGKDRTVPFNPFSPQNILNTINSLKPTTSKGALGNDMREGVIDDFKEGVVDSGGKKKGGGGRGSGGGAAAAPAKSVEDYAKETKDILSNLEKQAKLADNRGQYTKEADLYGKAQAEIDKMVARYKKAGYKETDDEILDLLNKRYDYEKKKDAASKKTIEEAAKELKDKLSNLDKQADVAEKQEDYLEQVKFYEKAQEAIKVMIDRYRKAGYKDDSDEILELLKKNYDYADKQVNVYKDRWNDLIDALESDTEAQDLANALAEKQQALEDARLALENAQKQRTIRMYNAQTGQWEWVADQKAIDSAQKSLTDAEDSYNDEIKSQAIAEIEKMRDNLADLNDVVLGPALSAIMAKSESSDEFQNFARALNAVYGVGSYLSSTEGSSKVISTASDSHDTIYTFGNVTLTDEQASSMTVAELAQKLQVLKIS